MTELFYAVLKASFQGSIVILAVLLLRLLLKKAPKSVFCLLWLLAGLRLVLPFEIRSSLSLQPDYTPAPQEIAGTDGREDILNNHADILIGTPDNFDSVPDTPAQPEANMDDLPATTIPTPQPVRQKLSFANIAAPVWLLGMGVMVLASLWSYLKLKRRVRMAYLIENGCFECPGLDTAFVLGFLPPKVYLPAGLTEDEKTFIYDHENTHIARGDHWFKLLGWLVLSLHWFNPLVWVGYSLLCRDIELACDEHVVRNMSLAQRKAYSAALLSCGGHTARIAACPVAFGESNPKKRILNVLNYKRPGFWISLAAVIAVIFVAVCLLTSPADKTEPELPEETQWNLEMQVTDVTPGGLTVKFIQSGEFPGCEDAVLQYGNAYTLQVNREGQWEDLEIISNAESSAWNLVAFPMELNGTTNCYVNWELRHGKLPTGHYRIAKAVALFRGAGDAEELTMYAEFVVFEDSAWNMDKTGEEYLAMCCDAVAEFQSRKNYHISETLVYYVNDQEDSRSQVAYWGDGTNNVRQSYVTRTDEIRTHLYYDGQLYYRVQADNGNPEWSLLKTDHDPRYNLTWLHLLQWDAQPVTFEYAEQVEDVLHVFFTVHSTVQPLGWDDVHEYTVGFFFDQSGRMTNALMGAVRDGINVMSDLKIETTSADSIQRKLEEFAEQRPEDLVQELKDEYYMKSQLVKCAEALQKCQAQGYWIIEENRCFPGGGSVNDTSSCVWYISGNSLLSQNAIPEDAGHWYLWQMCHESNSYHRQGFVTNGPEFGVGYETEWNKGLYDTASTVLTPWPLRFDWSAAKITYKETEKHEDGESVTFSVLGDPMLQNGAAQNYLVAFRLDTYGNLKYIRMWYLVSGGISEENTIAFRETSREDILDYINQCHAEALLHVHGICNDPSCTDAGHDHSGIACTDEHCSNSTHHHGENHH